MTCVIASAPVVPIATPAAAMTSARLNTSQSTSPRGGPQRDAKANLTRLFENDVREHAVDAHCCQAKRHDGECGNDAHAETPRSNRVVHDLGELFDLRHGQSRIGPLQRCPKRRHRRLDAACRAGDEADLAVERQDHASHVVGHLLREGLVHERERLGVERSLLDVADHAHNGHPRRPRNLDSPLDLPANRIGAAPHVSRQRLADDDDRLSRLSVSIGEESAPFERNAQGLEVAADRPRGGDHSAWGRHRPRAVIRCACATLVNVKRTIRARTGECDAWNLLRGLDRLHVERLHHLAVRVAAGRKRCHRVHDVLHPEARIRRQHLKEAAHEESGGDREHQRQRELRDDQTSEQTLTSHVLRSSMRPL